MKPDPNCSECGGTGVITLLTSSSPCGCLKEPIESDEEISNEYDLGYNEDCWE
jgi:hypothetical protein